MPTSSGQNFDFSRAEKLLKYVYADKVEELTPESTATADECEFAEPAMQLGRKFLMPVEHSRTAGFTYNSSGTVFSLNRSRAPEELQAEVLGSELLGRQSMSYKMLQSAMKGDTNTKAGLKAFVSATAHTFKALSKGGKYRRELTLLYGGGASPTTGTNLGVVAATTGSSGTSLVVTFAASDWATSIWAGSEGAAFDIYSGSTKRNAAGSGETSVFVLSSVDSANYKCTFTSDAANVSAVVPNDVIYFEGAYTTEGLGFVGAAATTTLWGLSTTAYNLWKPQTVAVGGQATFESIMEGAVKVADIGFQGNINIHVNPATFKDINDDQVALVRHTEKAKGSLTIGFNKITYQGPTGTFAIMPNIYMKRGIACGFPEGYCKRVGSTDLTFTMPGYGKMIRELEDSAGVEARIYSDQALFIERPAYAVYFSGIVNSTD
jgi:hypothetical protein